MKRRNGRQTRVWRSAASRRILQLAGDPARVEDAISIIANRHLANIDCPPTDLEALGRRVGILRFVSEPLPFSGELRREGGGFIVAYSSDLGMARRRFTIAHEIAHAIFEATGPNCPRTGRELERLCDMLASELLMPREIFLRECGEPSALGWAAINDLSKIFRTSLSATALRCAELLGVSVFELENETITWAFGAVRKGSLAMKDPELRAAVRTIGVGNDSTQSERAFYFGTENAGWGWWRMERRSIGPGDRSLVLLLPLGRRLGDGH